MSADNSVVVLEYKDGYKVKEIRAVENLAYGVKKGWLNLPELVWHFGDTQFTKDKSKAYELAENICKHNYIEYGIVPIKCNLTWNAIMNKAYQECNDAMQDSLTSQYNSNTYTKVIEICNKYFDKKHNIPKPMTVQEMYDELGKIIKDDCGWQPVFIEAFDEKEGDYIYSPYRIQGGIGNAGTVIK